MCSPYEDIEIVAVGDATTTKQLFLFLKTNLAATLCNQYRFDKHYADGVMMLKDHGLSVSKKNDGYQVDFVSLMQR
jgi:hypothetical protein